MGDKSEVERLRDSSGKWVRNGQGALVYLRQLLLIFNPGSDPGPDLDLIWTCQSLHCISELFEDASLKHLMIRSFPHLLQLVPHQHQMDEMLPLAEGRSSTAAPHASGSGSAIKQRLYGDSCYRRTAKNKIYTKVSSHAGGDAVFLFVFGCNLSATISVFAPADISGFALMQ